MSTGFGRQHDTPAGLSYWVVGCVRKCWLALVGYEIYRPVYLVG